MTLVGCDGGPNLTQTTTPPVGGPCADTSAPAVCDGNVVVHCDEGGQVASVEPCGGEQTCFDAACISCDSDVSFPAADADRVDEVGLYVEVDPLGPAADRVGYLVPVDVGGAAKVSWDGPFDLFDDAGDRVASGDTVGAITLRIGASEVGSGTLTLEGQCGDTALTVALRADSPRGVAGRSLLGFPWFETFDVFSRRDLVEALVDLSVHPDRQGLTAQIAVVEERSAEDWAREPRYTALFAPIDVTLDGSPVALWDNLPSSDELMQRFDVVVDFNANGRLDPGDLIDGMDGVAFAVGGNLAAPGPYTPVTTELSIDFWLTQRVYYPAEIATLPDAPLIVISHGNGHEYTWYDYLGDHLASRGYVVMSHRNNTQPGPVTAADTTWENTNAFLAGLSSIDGGVLDGHVDNGAIAWIGHSRGGEGVVIAYDWLVDGNINPSRFTVDDVTLVASIAPTVFEDPRQAVNPHGGAYHLIAGSSDGDVTGGPDSEVTQYYRILLNATGERSVTYVQGADHNDFNCCGFNDSALTSGPGVKIGRDRAQQLAKSYFTALLEGHFRDDPLFFEYLTRMPERFRPDGTDVVVATQYLRAAGNNKRVIDDFQTSPALDTSSSGGSVTVDVRNYAEGVFDDRNSQLSHDPSDPFNGMTQSQNDANAARGAVFEWYVGDDASIDFAVPNDARDFTAQAFVSLRACQATRHPLTDALATMASFEVALVDGAGNERGIDHRVYGGITQPYGRTGSGSGTGWSNEFQTIRVPVGAFDDGTLDMSDIRTIRLRFGAAHGSAQGRVGIDDLEILAGGAP